MNTIKIRNSEESSDWRDGFARGGAAGFPSRRVRPGTKTGHGRAGVNTVFLVGAMLSMMASVEAANVPAAVSAANLNNPVSSSVAEAPRHWVADTSNGCKVWSPEPVAEGITARWSGGCENGLAHGPGTVRWMSNNKQVAELTSTMEQGKMRGHTTGVEEPGNRFDGMFIDSLPEGEGKASFADGSTYSGVWHRGRQLGYGIMTFPPAHPQYQEMLNDGKGSKTENGIYMLRGWWEGKTFITPCDSEEECEAAVVALMKREQAAAAAKAGAPAAPAPAATVVPATDPAPAPTPAPIAPVQVSPVAEPAAMAPVSELPAMAPAIPATGPIPAPITVSPAPALAAPDVEPASMPAPAPSISAPNPELPMMKLMEPVEPAGAPSPALPGAEPAGEPAPPAAPGPAPAVMPAPETTAPAATDATDAEPGVPLTTNGSS